jgi:hypothetical protein
MKIYWITVQDKTAVGTQPHRCFFCTTSHEAHHEIEFRMKVPEENSILKDLYDENEVWDIEEEILPDSVFGRCGNVSDDIPYDKRPLTLANCPDCSVGTLRKMRNEMDDDGTCGTCPYFEKEL